MSLAAVGQYLVSGLTTGSVYALVAVGFSLIYSTCNLINFAQGEFAMLGGMLAAALLTGPRLSLPAAVAAAILATTLLGGLAALAMYPLRRISSLSLTILTIGLAIVLRGGAMLLWGKDARMLPAFDGRPPLLLRLGPDTVALQRQALWVLGAALLLAAALFAFFKTTNLGRAMRACAINRRGAEICGINPQKVMILAFALSAALGSAGGILIAPLTLTGYDMGIMLGLKGFCAAIIGGPQSMSGAVAGGLMLGVFEALGAGLISSHLKEILAFLALLGILCLRPAGLFGREGP